MGILMLYASVVHPQSNGQVEVTNRTSKEGLKKRLDEAKGRWVKELPNVLWDYRITTRTSIGKTPYSLVYKTEALLPIEVDIPTICTLHYDQEGNKKGLRGNLDLLEELRENVRLRVMTFKQRFNLTHNVKVRPKEIKVGGLVLLISDLTGPNRSQRTLRPAWSDPYIVIEETRRGVYRIKENKGKHHKNEYHSDDLRPYYV